MNIHEYQAKELLRQAGIPVQPGEVATTPDRGRSDRSPGRRGGRRQGPGARRRAGEGRWGQARQDPGRSAGRRRGGILGMSIKGLVVQRVLVAQAADIGAESYVGIIVDRASKRPVVMVSPAGGMDIEEVAATAPDRIRRLAVDPRYGLMSFEAMDLAFFLYKDVRQVRAAARILRQLYTAFMEHGASLVEINPLVTTKGTGELVAVDAKMSIDDNELERHPGLAALRDESAEAPSEIAARQANLTFIKLDGNVGCVVNGAGLAMATMDLVKYYGGEPANFLDIGGSSNPEKVVNALRIITSDPAVRVILFNIFGGITRTDDVATGIVSAIKQHPLPVPIVIRLTGTNEEVAVRILASAGLSAVTDMDEAVRAAVATVGAGRAA